MTDSEELGTCYTCKKPIADCECLDLPPACWVCGKRNCPGDCNESKKLYMGTGRSVIEKYVDQLKPSENAPRLPEPMSTRMLVDDMNDVDSPDAKARYDAWKKDSKPFSVFKMCAKCCQIPCECEPGASDE